MTQEELNQAIPPAYTEFIGTQLMAHLIANQEFPVIFVLRQTIRPREAIA